MNLPVLRERADMVRLFDPQTGEEVIPSEATTDKLAELRDTLRDYDETARIAKKTIDSELLARMDKAARWTVHIGGYDLSAPSPSPEVVYDAEGLHRALSALVAEGLIEADAVADAVEVETTYKPKKQAINRLRKLGGRVQEVIDSYATEEPRERRVSVKRKGAA